MPTHYQMTCTLAGSLELIEVFSYTEEEVPAIANQYLIPKQIKEAGLGM